MHSEIRCTVQVLVLGLTLMYSIDGKCCSDCTERNLTFLRINTVAESRTVPCPRENNRNTLGWCLTYSLLLLTRHHV